jgi:hypothetical protein
MKDYNKILRTGLAAVFMSAASNSALPDEHENNAYVEAVLASRRPTKRSQETFILYIRDQAHPLARGIFQ